MLNVIARVWEAVTILTLLYYTARIVAQPRGTDTEEQ